MHYTLYTIQYTLYLCMKEEVLAQCTMINVAFSNDKNLYVFRNRNTSKLSHLCFISIPLSLSLFYRSIYIPLSLFISLCLYIYISPSLSLSLSLSLSPPPSLHLSLSLYFYLSVSHCPVVYMPYSG